MSRYGTVLGGTANARTAVVQSADPADLAARTLAAIASLSTGLLSPVVTALTLGGAGAGHMFFVEIEVTAEATAEGGASVTDVQCFLGSTATAVEAARDALTSASDLIDSQIAGASAGQRVMGIVVFGTIAGGGGGGELVKVSAADTTAGFLDDKIVGVGLSTSILNPGGNEQLRLTVSSILATGPALTDADAVLAVAERYVLPAGTLTADRTLTITPPAQIGAGFLFEVGTQPAGQDYVIVNGGPLGGTLYTVVGGTRFAVWAVSDGTDMIIAAIMPLAVEPTP